MKKHTKKLITGVVLFVIGGLIAPSVITLLLFLHLLNEKPLAQFLIPTEVKITIEKEGKYYVWNDHHTIFRGKTYAFSEEMPNNLEISLHEENNKKTIEFHGYSSISSMTGNSSKSSIGYFEVSKPGVYTLIISGETIPRVFSFGKSFFNLKIFLCYFGTICSSVLIAIGGIIFVVIGIVELCKAKKTMSPEKFGT